MPVLDSRRVDFTQPNDNLAAQNLMVKNALVGAGVAVIFVSGNPNGVAPGSLYQLAIDVATGNTYQNTDGSLAWSPYAPGSSSGAAIFVVGDPNGAITGPLGQLAVDTVTGDVYQNSDGAMSWGLFLTPPGILTSAIQIGAAPTAAAINWIDVLDEHVQQILLNLRWRTSGAGHTSVQALAMFLDMQEDFDTTAAPASARGLEVDASSQVVAGPNALTNYGVISNARNGTQNFSWQSSQGIFRNDGLCVFGSVDSGDALFTRVGVVGLTTVQEFCGTSIAPAALAAGGTSDNWAPAGLSTATTVYITSAGVHTITGLTGERAARRIRLINASAFVLTFPALDAGSTAGRQFRQAFALNPDQVAELEYVSTAGVNKWWLVSLSP